MKIKEKKKKTGFLYPGYCINIFFIFTQQFLFACWLSTKIFKGPPSIYIVCLSKNARNPLPLLHLIWPIIFPPFYLKKKKKRELTVNNCIGIYGYNKSIKFCYPLIWLININMCFHQYKKCGLSFSFFLSFFFFVYVCVCLKTTYLPNFCCKLAIQISDRVYNYKTYHSYHIP